MLNLLVYIISVVILLFAVIVLKKGTTLRFSMLIIVGQAILISLFNSNLERPKKVGPLDFSDAVTLMQYILLIASLLTIIIEKKREIGH